MSKPGSHESASPSMAVHVAGIGGLSGPGTDKAEVWDVGEYKNLYDEYKHLMRTP